MIENTPIFNVTKETFDLLLDKVTRGQFNSVPRHVGTSST